MIVNPIGYAGGAYSAPFTYEPEDYTSPGGAMGGAAITGGAGGTTRGGTSLINQYPELFQAVPIPELPPLITPQALDIGRIQELTQQFASPAVRAARAAIREAMAGRRGSPIQRQYETRGALEGAGQAIETAIAGARQPASNIAMREAEQASIADRQNAEALFKKAMLEYEQKINIQNKTLAERRIENERAIAIEEKRAATRAQAGRHLGVGIPPWSTSRMGGYDSITERWKTEDLKEKEFMRQQTIRQEEEFQARKRAAAMADALGSSGKRPSGKRSDDGNVPTDATYDRREHQARTDAAMAENLKRTMGTRKELSKISPKQRETKRSFIDNIMRRNPWWQKWSPVLPMPNSTPTIGNNTSWGQYISPIT